MAASHRAGEEAAGRRGGPFGVLQMLRSMTVAGEQRRVCHPPHLHVQDGAVFLHKDFTPIKPTGENEFHTGEPRLQVGRESPHPCGFPTSNHCGWVSGRRLPGGRWAWAAGGQSRVDSAPPRGSGGRAVSTAA